MGTGRQHRARTAEAGAGGFTLLELLVVVTILVILVSILVPSMEQAFAATRRAVCASRLHSMMLAVQHYGSDNRQDVPAHAGPVGHWLWDLNPGSVRALLLYGAGGEDQRDLFHCPTNMQVTYDQDWLNGEREMRGDVLVVSYQWTMLRPVGPQYWGNLSGNQDDESFPLGGSYANGYVARAKLTEGGQATRTPFIADSMVFVYWVNLWSDAEFEGRRYGSNHMEGERRDGLAIPAGGNLAFIDGSVQWRDLDEASYNYAGMGPLWHW